MKTPKEIYELKQDWVSNPCWDIEDTEGFEDHKEELKAWRLDRKAAWLEEETKRLNIRSKQLGCSVATVRHIELLERKIERLEEKLES